MNCKPLEKYSVRVPQRWQKLADSLGVHSLVIQEVYINRYFTGIHVRDFFNLLTKRDDPKFVASVIEACEIVKMTGDELLAKEKQLHDVRVEQDFMDEMMYRLKCIIEVGDEWLCDETKTYCFSGIQYETEGKRYVIKTLKDDDEGGSDFGFTTTTDLPEEIGYHSVYSCKSIWRNGVELWNWNQAYLDLWLEQNPGHPDTQKMIEHLNGGVRCRILKLSKTKQDTNVQT